MGLTSSTLNPFTGKYHLVDNLDDLFILGNLLLLIHTVVDQVESVAAFRNLPELLYISNEALDILHKPSYFLRFIGKLTYSSKLFLFPNALVLWSLCVWNVAVQQKHYTPLQLAVILS